MYRVLISNNYDDIFANSEDDALDQFIAELRKNIISKTNKEIQEYLDIIIFCEEEY